MKKLIIASLFAVSTGAFANSNIADFPDEFPTNWEQNIIAKACGFDASNLEGTVGVTTRTRTHVTYTAVSNGSVVATASRRRWTLNVNCN